MVLILLSVFIPIIAGLIILIFPGKKCDVIRLKKVCGGIYAFDFLMCILAVFLADSGVFNLIRITDGIEICFRADTTGRIFALIMSLVCTLAGFFAFEYMKHEDNNKLYFGLYTVLCGVLPGLCFAGNLVTFYAFYEMMTLVSFGLVLHNRSKEAVMASYKYLFYSFAGAYLVLFGTFIVYSNTNDKSMMFTSGGIIDINAAVSAGRAVLSGGALNGGVLSLAMLFMIIGFSVKAGMFPMHSWLISAHPNAPAPASAILSGVIVKGGILGVIRVIYYVFGVNLFSGSNIQKIVLVLALITVFMGSMLAFREKVLKKRLAYSTVSQASYILVGLFFANETAYFGSILHVAAHAFIKSVLFMCAGAIIFVTGCTRVDELKGIGKKMPVLIWCFTLASLGLIGIPPFGGFISKWYLCTGALASGMKGFAVAAPVILLISALLTAGYLLSITTNAFLPGCDFNPEANEDCAYNRAKEPARLMLIPVVILTILSIAIGIAFIFIGRGSFTW